jgi:hypothetical protein
MKNPKLRIMAILCMLGLITSCPDLFKAGSGNNDPAPAPAGPAWKIGIATMTENINKEDYWMARKLQSDFEDGKILHALMPDNFMSNTAGVIQAIAGLAQDPEVKAIVVVQAVPGTAAAIDSVRLTRPDMLFIVGVPGDHSSVIAPQADLVLHTNDLARGEQIALQAKAMGATTLVHYSFPRHMSYELLSARRDLMAATASSINLNFVSIEETVPDPTIAGLAATQTYILEDVPKQVAKYGTDTAFFGTNCGMMVPLIRAVLDEGAIFPVQCCPSPLHALPEALDIEISSEQMADISWVLEQIKLKVAEEGANGRIATWPMPVNMMYLAAGVHYADAILAGTIDTVDGFLNLPELEAIMIDLSGKNVTISNLGVYENYILFLSDPIIF